MSKKTVYILHKNGADSHYIALANLLNKQGIVLKYREFSVFGRFFKSIFGLNGLLFKKQCVNLIFLIKLLLSKNKKVVLGIAPFDAKLIPLKKLLKKHKVYYHTSWACWDGSFHPKYKKNTPKVKTAWKHFLENDVQHIFTVTEKSKSQLLNNYAIKNDKISVVNHALDNSFFVNTENVIKQPLSFIYLGRLLPQKGIFELLDFFSKQNLANLTIVGSGKEEEQVKEFSNNYDNITFIPYIKDKEDIINTIAKHEYLVLNSKKTKKWEELFGLVIIECMAHGTIPIATNHTGPKEIINNNIGFLCNEGEMCDEISKIISAKTFNQNMSIEARKSAKLYSVDTISLKWKTILN